MLPFYRSKSLLWGSETCFYVTIRHLKHGTSPWATPNPIIYATPPWATPHPNELRHKPQPNEQRHTPMSYAKSSWAMPHPLWATPHSNELRHTPMSYATPTPLLATPHPLWATPHSNELRHTPMSYATPKELVISSLKPYGVISHKHEQNLKSINTATSSSKL